MAYRFRKISEEDNNVIASIIRNNLEQFHLDIPGTAYYDEGLDRLSECYKDPGSGYFVLVGDDERVVDGRFFSFYNETDLDWISDLGLIEYWITEYDRPERPREKWLNTLWRKM